MNEQHVLGEGVRTGAGGSEERFETVIVGGGQSGLATGYQLTRLGRPFVILDASERIGDGWRTRWDSLRLFTPAKYNGLPGVRFPAKGVSFPTKDEMADYLEDYAARFDLPLRKGVRVDSVSRNGHGYVVTAGERRYEADNVVVASGAFQTPKIPVFAGELDPSIKQLHSSEYKDPTQLRAGGALVVGAGNSGAEIALEIAQSHRTWLSGKAPGQIPVRHGPAAARFFLPLVRFLGSHVLTTRSPIGRKVRPMFLARGTPLIRTRVKDLTAAGVVQVGRTVGVREGAPEVQGGQVLDVANVVWCTGFRPDFRWIDLAVWDENGHPRHRRGVVADAPGLYFMGLVFQYAAVSDTLAGVGRDAAHVAKHIASRVERASATT